MTTATRRAKRFRLSPVRGHGLGVDREREVIRGIAVMQVGDINEQDVRQQFVDEKTQQQFVAMAQRFSGKLKGRFTHPDMSNDGLGSFLGKWSAPRIDGDFVRMDLAISPRAHNSPTLGDIGTYTLDLADSDPDMLGASMVCMLDDAAMEKEKRKDGFMPIRLKSLFAVDIVDTAALTKRGLFSARETLLVPSTISQVLDHQYAALSAEEIRQRAGDYLDRYITNRFGEKTMADSNTTAPAGVTKAELDSAINTAIEGFAAKLDEKFAALKPEPNKESEPTLEDAEKAGAKRASEIMAFAATSGLNDHAKLATDAVAAGQSVESFKASLADRLITQNKLSKDGESDSPEDPHAKFRAEFKAGIASGEFAAYGIVDEELYVRSRCRDEGMEVPPIKQAS